MSTWLRRTVLVVLALLLVPAAGCGGKSTNEGDSDAGDIIDAADTDASDIPVDSPADTPGETPEDSTDDTPGDSTEDTPEDTTVDAETDTPDDPADDTPGDSAPDAPADSVADTGSELVPGSCGDGTLNSGEVCDDGNTVTEPCDTTLTTACLSDCSLLMPECGDASPDAGEQCDDGNLDSTDSCTTSCTLNDESIGAACLCTGGCSMRDPSAGTISGCDSMVPLATSARAVACMSSINDTLYRIDLHYAEGYCTLMARSCTGMGVCGLLPDIGDVTSFSCPTGYAVVTSNPAAITSATIVMKTCHPICTSDSECRWNAEESSGSPWYPGCGQYRCVPRGDGGESICVDLRNPY